MRTWAAPASPARAGSVTLVSLAELTEAWSFPERVSPAAVAGRDEADLAAAVHVLMREIVPHAALQHSRKSAEQLFVGLRSGRVPPEFAEVHVMALTGWSWATLRDTPADIVHRMVIYMAVKQALDSGGALELAEVPIG
jgi:hypothetical protein